MSFFPDGYDSVTAAKLRNGVDICKFFEPRRANLRNEAVFDGLFQQFSVVVAAFKYAHLMDGDLIELDEPLMLWHPLFNEHRVEILHIGEAYKFVDGGVIPDIAFEVGIGFMPFFAVMPNMATFNTSASLA